MDVIHKRYKRKIERTQDVQWKAWKNSSINQGIQGFGYKIQVNQFV